MRFNQIARQIEIYRKDMMIDALVVSLAHPMISSAGLSIMKDVSVLTGIPLHCGIGGCEALRDMYDAKNTGVDAVIAPMIDSTYAVEKFAEAVDIVFGQSERNEIKAYISLSTVDAVRIAHEIADRAAEKKINGIIINIDECVLSADGRTDRVVETVRQALDNIKMKGISCCIDVSGEYDGIDVCTGYRALESVMSGVLRVRNCSADDDLRKFTEMSKRITGELYSECGRIVYDFSENNHMGRCPGLGVKV